MKIVIAKVIQVTGRCNAGHILGDEVIVNLAHACVDKEKSGNLCIFALSPILSNMSRIKQGEKILASCPDPATGMHASPKCNTLSCLVTCREYRKEFSL